MRRSHHRCAVRTPPRQTHMPKAVTQRARPPTDSAITQTPSGANTQATRRHGQQQQGARPLHDSSVHTTAARCEPRATHMQIVNKRIGTCALLPAWLPQGRRALRPFQWCAAQRARAPPLGNHDTTAAQRHEHRPPSARNGAPLARMLKKRAREHPAVRRRAQR